MAAPRTAAHEDGDPTTEGDLDGERSVHPDGPTNIDISASETTSDEQLALVNHTNEQGNGPSDTANDEQLALANYTDEQGNEPTKTDSDCLLYTSPSPRDQRGSRMPSSA